MRQWLGLFIVLAALPLRLFAGPPFQLDDPDVIPFQHFEFYTFASAGSAPGAWNVGTPAFEFNWSGVRNVMFHFLVPATFAIPQGAPVTFGLGDSEVGLQYRFVSETKHRPMIGTFVMLEVPTGNPARGLGAGKPQWKLPIWMQKTVNGFTIDWGGGENLSHIPGMRNYAFGGALVQHDLSSKLTLGSELFYHGRQTAGIGSSRDAALLDIGGYYHFRNPDFQLLFCYGHSVAGQVENYGYLGLYWTWGPAHPRGGLRAPML